ncbi:hypothetical protein SDC9_181747 [bioreactor metagenome]|uniref:Uncharacterized protein n=1 Tax=bioreactor metagenome TaxID=1076179 RepID=A0A645HDT3_9ZZZZ
MEGINRYDRDEKTLETIVLYHSFGGGCVPGDERHPPDGFDFLSHRKDGFRPRAVFGDVFRLSAAGVARPVYRRLGGSLEQKVCDDWRGSFYRARGCRARRRRAQDGSSNLGGAWRPVSAQRRRGVSYTRDVCSHAATGTGGSTDQVRGL